MLRRKKLIIAILLVILLGLLAMIAGALFISGPDLTQEDKNILVLASDKGEQQHGSIDMAFMVHLSNGSLDNYTPVYPGGMTHPSIASPVTDGNLLLHDCMWDGTDKGMDYAAEIVEANTGMHADAVVLVYDAGIDAVIDSIRPLYVDGVESNLSATDIVRSNDAYNGYPGSENMPGTMSRGDSVMVLVKALANVTKDPDKKDTMVKAALDQYSKGNVLMKPEGSFAKLLATKGFESLGG
jgi:anionic cell wall polymer biosynthesis LytR-Cps2A-Psr (LCP) family protein